MVPSVTAGVVYLVGAGPGAPDLITVRGLRILRAADVVLPDALIAPELLAEARPDAERIAVGKRGYCVGSTRQETINDALVRLARAGKSVCRLKCGDPCLFGRGGEEAEVLAEAGVPFEIVPGVTSATSACAAAGIPLTHRAVGQAVVLATGHHDPDSPDCTLDWPALARMPGIVFYMAGRHIARIAARLSDWGMSLDTPAAVIESATLPHQRIIVGDLATIGQEMEAAGVALDFCNRSNGTRMNERIEEKSSDRITGWTGSETPRVLASHPVILSKLCSDPLDRVFDPLRPRAIASPPKSTGTPESAVVRGPAVFVVGPIVRYREKLAALTASYAEGVRA